MKDLILCDVTGKGVIELVVSLTDRVVRTYRWKKTTVNSCNFKLHGSYCQSLTLVLSFRFRWQPRSDDEGAGRLVSVNKWEFASQIGTVRLF